MADQLDASWLWFLLGVLAVWRVTHLVHAEHGPWGILARSRAAAARLGFGEVFACFYCLSLWTAAPAAFWLASSWPARVVAWLALSAGAILIEVRGLGGVGGPSSPGDTDDAMLR